jgi:hypothetical protein
MSFRNPNSENSTEIRETLGPKFQNAQKFILRVSGGALEKDILSYAKFFLNIQVLGAETLKRRGSCEISGNPRRVIWNFYGNPKRVVWFCKRGE